MKQATTKKESVVKETTTIHQVFHPQTHMPTTSQGVFDVPPLPRYRYNRKTGTWQKEETQPDEAAAHTHDGSNTAAPAPNGAAAAARYTPFESSYDFFLRTVKPSLPKRTQAERNACKREATNASIRDFEAALYRRQSTAMGGRRLHVTSETPERSGSAQRVHSSTITATSAPAGAAAEGLLHPLVGYASTASMPAVYAAIAALKPHPLNFASSSPAQDERLDRQEFYTFLAAVGPAEVLSKSYADAMLCSLPSFDSGSGTVAVLAVLTLLLDHRYHSRFDANVTALFRAFDVEQRGVVAVEVLHPDLIAAWAEVRTFGKLREQWTRLAAVIAEEMSSAAVSFPHMPELVPRAALRAFFSCSEALYAAMCSLDLDGSSL